MRLQPLRACFFSLRRKLFSRAEEGCLLRILTPEVFRPAWRSLVFRCGAKPKNLRRTRSRSSSGGRHFSADINTEPARSANHCADSPAASVSLFHDFLGSPRTIASRRQISLRILPCRSRLQAATDSSRRQSQPLAQPHPRKLPRASHHRAPSRGSALQCRHKYQTSAKRKPLRCFTRSKYLFIAGALLQSLRCKFVLSSGHGFSRAVRAAK